MPGATPCATLPYPLDSDPIDVANDIRLLALATDNALCGLPKLPLGTILPWLDFGGALDSDYLRLEGGVFNPVTYPALSAYLGGSSTLPDLRERFLRGTGGTFSTPGGFGGWADAIVVTHNHTGPEHQHSIAQHAHTATTANDSHGHVFAVRENMNAGGSSGEPMISNNTGTADIRGVTSDEHNHVVTVNQGGPTATGLGGTGTTGDSGASGTNRNLPPFFNVTFIIKATP